MGVGGEGQCVQHGSRQQRRIAPRKYFLVFGQDFVADDLLECLSSKQVVQGTERASGANGSYQAMGADNGPPHQDGSLSIRS